MGSHGENISFQVSHIWGQILTGCLPNRHAYRGASKDTHKNVRSSMIRSDPHLGTTQMPLTSRMDKLA